MNIFFRNDDVGEFDDDLKKTISVFIDNNVPIHLSVIPGNLTDDCRCFIEGIMKKHPGIIEIGQHGFDHSDHSGSKDRLGKYEFGKRRTYEDQKKDIIEGKNMLNGICTKGIFTPPWHGYDSNTLKILSETGFNAISTDMKTPILDNVYGLKTIPTSIYLNKRIEGGWFTESTEKIIEEIEYLKRVNRRSVGIQMHHDSFRSHDEINSLSELIRKLKEMGHRFIRLSDAIEHNVSTKGFNINALQYYLAYQFVPKPLSLTQDTSASNLVSEKYDFSDIIEESSRIIKSEDDDAGMISEKKLEFEIYDNIKKAIKRTIPKDRKDVGLLLSGGFDSACLLHAMSESLGIRIYTITAAFDPDSPNIKTAQGLADKYGTKHTTLIINAEDLPKIKDLYDKDIPQPIGDNGFLSTYLMMKELSKYTDLVVTADGCDCLFSGLSSHYKNYIHHRFLKELDIDSAPYPDDESYEHYRFGEIFTSNADVHSVISVIQKDINSKSAVADIYMPLHIAKTNSLKNEICNRDLLKKQALLDLDFLVKNRVDYLICSAQRSGIALSTPFLDKTFVEFSLGIPSSLMIKNLTQKYILKRTFEGKLDQNIIHQKKVGLSPPFRAWYESNRIFVEDMLLKSIRLGISQEYIKKLILNIKNSCDYIHGMRIWLIINLICWSEANGKI